MLWNITDVNDAGGRCGLDHMVVGFTTTYAISAYHHWCCEFESLSERGVHHYVIKFVSELRQLVVFSGSSGLINKTDCHDVTEILLKVSLYTTKQTNKWMMHGENYLVIQYSSTVFINIKRFYRHFKNLFLLTK
jgi:hypothetical protein